MVNVQMGEEEGAQCSILQPGALVLGDRAPPTVDEVGGAVHDQRCRNPGAITDGWRPGGSAQQYDRQPRVLHVLWHAGLPVRAITSRGRRHRSRRDVDAGGGDRPARCRWLFHRYFPLVIPVGSPSQMGEFGEPEIIADRGRAVVPS